MKNENRELSYFALRVTLGLLFIIPGFAKLMNPASIQTMLSGIGIPFPEIFGWIVILSEIICGSALILGFRVREMAWPLVIILIVATLFIHMQSINPSNSTSVMNVLWHLVGIAALVHLQTVGGGKYRI